MTGALEGVKVVELGLWVARTSAGAVLCAWGAEVVKIAPPQGDPFRGLFASVLGSPISVNPPFETDNRGKRSVALDLQTEEARRIAHQLLEGADVFVTNMRPRVLDQYGLSYDELGKRYPRVVYAQITGYGPDGGRRGRRGY